MIPNMGMYPDAGMGLAGEKNSAAAGMRGLQERLFQESMNRRNRGMDQSIRDAGKDRRNMIYSTLLGSAGNLPWGAMMGGGGPPGMGQVSQLPQSMMQPPSFMPPGMLQDRFRTGMA